MSFAQLWIILALVLGIVEVLVMSAFLIWMAIAAFVVAVLTWIFPDMGLPLQLIIFAVVSLILLIRGRPTVQRIMAKQKGQTVNERGQSMVGQSGVIASGENGKWRVKLGDTEWSAESDDEALAVGQRVKVESVDGIVLRVVASGAPPDREAETTYVEVDAGDAGDGE